MRAGYRRAESAAWRRLGDETVVLHLKRNVVLALDQRGGVVWDTLAEPATLEQLAAAVYGEAAGGREQALVAGFLGELAREGLVEAEDGAALPGPFAAGTGEAPRVVWREQLHRAAGGCLFLPGQGDICSQLPFQS